MEVSVTGNAFYTASEAFNALESFVRDSSKYHLNKFWAMVKNDERLDLALLTDNDSVLLEALVDFIGASDLRDDASEWFSHWATCKQVEWADDGDDDLRSWQRLELLDNVEHDNYADHWHSIAN